MPNGIDISAGIEGNPFIIRFKTVITPDSPGSSGGIEGNPFIIRFKTPSSLSLESEYSVLKVIHL